MFDLATNRGIKPHARPRPTVYETTQRNLDTYL